ncbi:MAG: hypothetical protein IJ458_01565 [Clostridia bacterium]|nr:hypothetical protein [Clostridia bacterium]
MSGIFKKMIEEKTKKRMMEYVECGFKSEQEMQEEVNRLLERFQQWSPEQRHQFIKDTMEKARVLKSKWQSLIDEEGHWRRYRNKEAHGHSHAVESEYKAHDTAVEEGWGLCVAIYTIIGAVIGGIVSMGDLKITLASLLGGLMAGLVLSYPTMDYIQYEKDRKREEEVCGFNARDNLMQKRIINKMILENIESSYLTSEERKLYYDQIMNTEIRYCIRGCDALQYVFEADREWKSQMREELRKESEEEWKKKAEEHNKLSLEERTRLNSQRDLELREHAEWMDKNYKL